MKIVVKHERTSPATGAACEGGYMVARDENGDWRAYGRWSEMPTGDQARAEWLFHKSEIESVGHEVTGETVIWLK